MSKETNHRRKAKVAKKVEELDIEKLSRELIKPRYKKGGFNKQDKQGKKHSNKQGKKWDGNTRDKGKKDYKPKNNNGKDKGNSK